MKTFQIHTLETAPEKSKPGLQGLQHGFGFIPNAAATMAGSPALLGAFIGSFGSFHNGTFTEAEKQVLLLSNAVALNCHWTVAFHSAVALKSGVDQEAVTAIRNRKRPSNPKFAALSSLTQALIERKGHAADIEVETFLNAGYDQAQVLEVIAGIAISTMAATTASLAATPVEPRFAEQVWNAA